VAFLEEVRAGRAPDTAYYNAGTAALRAGRYDVARGALTEATKSLDPGLRYRALYNLGLAAMLEAQADSSRGDALLPQAVEHFQEALQLQPGSPRAKWNLELAQRRRPPPSGGGGGAGTPPPSPSAPQQQPSQSRPEPEPLSQAQAEQILNSMERQERQTRADQIRRMQGGTGGGVKDW
jgi:tetratricopeptide (TPR) repeat protein